MKARGQKLGGRRVRQQVASQLLDRELGAEAAGREFDRDSFYTCSLTTAVILEAGEDLTSPRVIEECGPFVLSGLHYLYDQQHQFNREPPPHVRPVWNEYCALVEQTLSRDATCAFTPGTAPTPCPKRSDSSPRT